MLGPHARRIAYSTTGQLHAVPTGSGGAYLIVLPATKGSGYFESSLTPAGSSQPIRQITYRDGSVCNIPSAANAAPCPAVGYVPVGLPRPDQVASALHVVHRIKPAGSASGQPDDQLSVDFTARVAVNNAEEAYVLVLLRPSVGRCIAGGFTTTSSDTNITSGTRVTLRIDGKRIGPCPGGRYSGTIYYAQNALKGPLGVVRVNPQLLPLGQVVPVGHFSFIEP